MIISFSPSVTGVNTLLSKKFAWKINDLSTENLPDPVLNYTEFVPAGKILVHRKLEVYTVYQRFLTSWQRPTPKDISGYFGT